MIEAVPSLAPCGLFVEILRAILDAIAFEITVWLGILAFFVIIFAVLWATVGGKMFEPTDYDHHRGRERVGALYRWHGDCVADQVAAEEWRIMEACIGLPVPGQQKLDGWVGTAAAQRATAIAAEREGGRCYSDADSPLRQQSPDSSS